MSNQNISNKTNNFYQTSAPSAVSDSKRTLKRRGRFNELDRHGEMTVNVTDTVKNHMSQLKQVIQ